MLRTALLPLILSMARERTKRLLTSLFLCLLACTPCQAQAQSTQSIEAKLREKHYPIVDMGHSQPDQVSPELRTRRSKRYNVGPGRPLQEPSAKEEFGGTFEPFPIIPALPVKESDSIIVGTVTTAAAHLSAFKDNVYSEFRITPERVMKTSGTEPAIVGQAIDVERAGGAVRFPSGKILYVRMGKEDFLRAGRRYILFLREQPDTRNHYLVTAYELENGKVEPLDGDGELRGSGARFTQYRGVDEDTFVRKVTEHINEGASQ